VVYELPFTPQTAGRRGYKSRYSGGKALDITLLTWITSSQLNYTS